MRTLAISSAVAVLLTGAPTFVQAQQSPAPPKAQSQPQAQQAPAIRSIQVVDVDDLQADLRSKIDSLVANTKDEEIQSLRKSIDATPQAVSALQAKGRSSAQVVAINIDEGGTLTMFTKKAA